MRKLTALCLTTVFVAGVLWFCTTEGTAEANATIDAPYSYEQTWTAATRMLRVDMGYKITERDETAGYLLFEYTSPESGKRVTPGSIELLRPRSPGAAVHVTAHLNAMPDYHERVLLDALTRKLHAEYGEPVRPAASASSAPKSPSRDAGTDG
jgi:hypothetical protein